MRSTCHIDTLNPKPQSRMRYGGWRDLRIDTNVPERSLNLTNGRRFFCRVVMPLNGMISESDQAYLRTWVDQEIIEQRIQGGQAVDGLTLG